MSMMKAGVVHAREDLRYEDIEKPVVSEGKVLVKVKYTGFEIPDEFVVGYGLDYAQRHRNLPYIGIVEFDS